MQSIKKYSSRIEFVDSVLNQSNLKILDIGGGGCLQIYQSVIDQCLNTYLINLQKKIKAIIYQWKLIRQRSIE